MCIPYFQFPLPIESPLFVGPGVPVAAIGKVGPPSVSRVYTAQQIPVRFSMI